MKNNIKKLFIKTNEIDTDFKGWTLSEILSDIQSKPNYRSEEMYIKSTLGDNHAVLTTATKDYFQTYHHFTYYKEEHKLHVESEHSESVLLLLFIPIIMIGAAFFKDNWYANLFSSFAIPLGFSIIGAGFLTLKLYSDAKDMEREVIIRINYKLRNFGSKK